MKKVSALLYVIWTISYAFCTNEAVEVNQNINISSNPQDVPFFYNNHPLTGLKAFAVITSFPLKDANLQMEIGQTIETALSEIGEVVHLKDNDMRGFGAGNILIIQTGNISGWEGSEMPISRISLGIETPTTLDKTGMKTVPIIWSINTFLNGTIDSASEGTLNKAIQKLVSDFTDSYQCANKNQAKKPVFYIYD